MSVSLSRRLFTAEEFRNMAEAGLLRKEDDRLELVEGEIVEMSPIGHRHARCVRKLNELFHELLRQVYIDVQNPLGVTRSNEFYPDIVLLSRREDGYAGAIPEARDALLVIEVADTTLEFDRTIKVPRYAEAGVPEVWIVDIQSNRIWVHRKPLAGVYGEVFECRPGDTLAPSAVPGFEVSVDDVLS